MTVPISLRRPFLAKLKTSMLKRRVRLRRSIARWLDRDESPRVCRYFGVDFSVSPRELIGDEIAINRLDWRELNMMIAACREYRPQLFIDVGANIGLYSCILARAAVVPRVVAFEPDPDNFARLAENIARNGFTDLVQPRPDAVGAGRGRAFLTPGPPENRGLSKIGDTGTSQVSVVALDDEFDLAGSAIAIKIDVEGHELDVLAGAAGLFHRNGGYAQIEGHGDERAAQIGDTMRAYGWRLVDRYGLDLRFERIAPAPSA